MKKDIHSSIVFLLVFILITACTHGKTAPAKSLDTVKIKQTQSSHFSTSQQSASSSSQTSSSQTATPEESNASTANEKVPSESIDNTDKDSHAGGKKSSTKHLYNCPTTVELLCSSHSIHDTCK